MVVPPRFIKCLCRVLIKAKPIYLSPSGEGFVQPKFRRGAARKEKAVKEQLANMTIIELVTTAHSYATSIQQIDTYSAIVTELASRLEALNIAYIRAMNIVRSAADDRSQQQTGITFVSADELSAVLARVQGLHEISVELIAEDVFKQHAASPTTDAWQREMRQKAWAEGINYTAGRLAAAFNHGCVNKPMAEVGDIVRMILTTKDDLANDPAPAADGLSGEYAEKALEDWEQLLRNGEAV